MFRLKPEGKTLIEVCTTLSCALGGAEELVEHACRRLGVKPGETTADGKFTVKGVECLAACGGAPAVQVNGEWLEHATSADVDKVIAGEKVARSFAWPKSPGEHILLANVWKEGSTSLAVYEATGGYAKLGEWLKREPEAIVDEVKKSGLRGRGGAGFPTGMKWGFLPKDNPKPRYMCVNADESEPGTYKDRVLIERDPHRLIESHRRELPRDPLEDAPTSTSAASSTRARARSRRRSTRRARRATSARTSSAPASTSRSTSTAARAPTSAARRRRSSSRSRASAASRASSRRSRRWWASTAARRSSTTSRRS